MGVSHHDFVIITIFPVGEIAVSSPKPIIAILFPEYGSSTILAFLRRATDVVGGPMTKKDRAIRMMQRPGGATWQELARALGWQRHTVRVSSLCCVPGVASRSGALAANGRRTRLGVKQVGARSRLQDCARWGDRLLMKQAGLVSVIMLVIVGTVCGEEHGLKGINSFGVVVENPPEDLGLNVQAISDYVKTLVAFAHLRVVTPAEATGGETVIDVVVNCSRKSAKAARALNVQLEIVQPVVTVRELMPFLISGKSSTGTVSTPTIVENAVTWRTSQIGVLEPAADATTSVKASVGLLFDLLLADYKTENP